MNRVNTPTILFYVFNRLHWRIPVEKPQLFLTFDDGPIPENTGWILEQLADFDAKATFFCVGDNVRKYPELLEKIIEEGHAVGNHTFNHLNGWKTKTSDYIENINKAQELIKSDLFRPPYGKFNLKQKNILQKRFHIIMWDVLSRDYDASVSPEDCFMNVARHAKEGSIVVFHDSVKSAERLQYALPQTLEHFSRKGYSFPSISSSCFS